MICTNCSGKVPPSARNCPSCQTDVGFPNIRAAESPDEERALQERLDTAYVSADSRGCRDVLDRFGGRVLTSKAVFCRNLSVLFQLLSSDNSLYISFHQEVAAGSRLPKDDLWERGRPAVEATLFPHYHNQINFACLSLDGKGMTNYGAYSIILKEKMIALRSSVFEENPFLFMQKHRIIAGDPIPAGFRASWQNRGRFAMAKLHSKIDNTTKEDQFPGILLQAGTDSGYDEFVEVHIYGPIHPTSFERIIGPRPVKKADLVLWKSLQSKCKSFGITLEES